MTMLTAYAKKLLDAKGDATRRGGSCDSRSPARPAASEPVPEDALPETLAKFPHHMAVRDVAEYFNISQDAVRLFVDSGEMQFVNVSPGDKRPCYRVLRSSVAAFESKHQTGIEK